MVYYFTDEESDGVSYTDRIRPLAKHYQEYLKFVIVDSLQYPEMPSSMGLGSGRGLAVQNTHNGQVFPYLGSASSISADEAGDFITAISQGSVQPWTGQYEIRSVVSPNRDEL